MLPRNLNLQLRTHCFWLSIGKTIRSFAISRSIMYICNLDLHLTTAYALTYGAGDRNRRPAVPGLSHPRSSYPLKTQCYMASQAHLALGNVMSSMLKMPKAVQSYRLAGRYLQRLRAPDGSEAKAILAGMQASLQCNIGNQYKKENLFGKAMEAYQTAATLADQASDTDLGLQVRGKRRLFLCGVFSHEAIVICQARLRTRIRKFKQGAACAD
jgi:hypothetical protein